MAKNYEGVFKALGWGGLIFVLLQLISHAILIQAGGMEPPFTASGGEILEFFKNRNPVLFPLGGSISVFSFLAFLAFLSSLYSMLKHAGTDSGVLRLIALGSGIAWVAVLAGGHAYWAMAYFRVEVISSEMAQILFDLGNFTFAISWVFMAGFIFPVGLVAINSNVLPKWFGWFSLILGVLLVVGFFNWLTLFAFVPFLFTYFWFISGSIIIFRFKPPMATA